MTSNPPVNTTEGSTVGPNAAAEALALLRGLEGSLKEIEALIRLARDYLEAARATVHDGLPTNSDRFLRASILQDIGDADDALRRALL